MPANKIVFNTADGAQTLIDLTEDKVTPSAVFEGVTFHGADGEVKTGTFTLEQEMSEQDSLIAQIRAALQGKAAGGGTATPTQEKNVEITKNGTVEVLPDDGYALHRVEVSVSVPIPDGYIVPSGELEITESGTHDVTQYASVKVNVEGASAPDPRDQYQRVEYIESAEEATYPYIVTDFVADNSSGLEVIASFPAMIDRVPMGSRDSGDTRFYCVYPLSTTSIYYGFNTGKTISCKLAVDTVYRLQTNFLNSRLATAYEKNGTQKGSGSINATLTQQTVPVAIFGCNSSASNAVISKREFKLYSARISQGHEVVREYIPCYRKSDGEIGVYEKFTGTFLTNAGDGSFAKGADIDWEVEL